MLFVMRRNLSMRKLLQVVTRSTRGKNSPWGVFASVLKTGAKFHPGLIILHDFNVWLQFILNPALFCGQCMSNPENTLALSPFLCLNNWYNVQIATLRIFLKNFTLKEQKLTKYFFYEKMRHWWIKTTNFPTHPLVHHPLNVLAPKKLKNFCTTPL